MGNYYLWCRTSMPLPILSFYLVYNQVIDFTTRLTHVVKMTCCKVNTMNLCFQFLTKMIWS